MTTMRYIEVLDSMIEITDIKQSLTKEQIEQIEQNLCNYFNNEFINGCKLTEMYKTDTGYYVKADATFKVGVENFNGLITADLRKDLSVKDIMDEKSRVKKNLSEMMDEWKQSDNDKDQVKYKLFSMLFGEWFWND